MLNKAKTNRTLLLVDDEQNVLAALKRLFHTSGYTILYANSAKQVIDIDRFRNINESLSHSIGDKLLKNVADRLHQIKGVETDNQLKFLADRNCDIEQSYLFSKPLPSYDLKTYQSRYTQQVCKTGGR